MFHALLQVLWGVTAQKGHANGSSDISDPWCQEQTSGYHTLVLVINPSWSECHPNPSIVLLHASNFYSMKMEVYNRGMISRKWPWRWGSLKHFSLFCLPSSQDNVSGSEVGTWFLLKVVRQGRENSYFVFLMDSTKQDWISNRKPIAPERYVFQCAQTSN